MALAGKTVSIHDASGFDQVGKRLKLDPGVIRQVRGAFLRSLRGEAKAMEAIPVGVRDGFAAAVRFHELTPADRRDSRKDGATKVVFRTSDYHLIESVILRIQSGRSSLCVSSQTGCVGGCRFCATGRIKGGRNLTSAEVLDQVVRVGEILVAEGRRLRNVVLMGMGEPLLNEDVVCSALAALQGNDGFNLSGRHLLVSTLGIPGAMRRLAAKFPQVGLAVSLHSARQSVRDALMPLARRWPLGELRQAILDANTLQDRTVMIEVLMLDGVTDTEDDQAALIEWLTGLRVHVNLIPYNPVGDVALDGVRLRASQSVRIQSMLEALKAASFTTTRRRSLGADIGAACGQLAGDQSEQRQPD